VQVAVDGGADGSGLVALGGATVARGYRGGAGAADLTERDGTRWFRTSDLGRWDGERLRVLGRADDVLVTGGVKVSPQAVEAVLVEVPGVRECLVVGVPDAEWGQALVALVVPDPGHPPTLEALRHRASEQLGGHAAPRRLQVVPALPLRGVGKPDRAAGTRLAAGGLPAAHT
jgi:O-succinylbenzoic acid--CoA ligase